MSLQPRFERTVSHTTPTGEPMNNRHFLTGRTFISWCCPILKPQPQGSTSCTLFKPQTSTCADVYAWSCIVSGSAAHAERTRRNYHVRLL